MKSQIMAVFLVPVLCIAATLAIYADDLPGKVSLLPAQQAVADAARISDPVTREAALRDAIRTGLLESEPAVAKEVLGYLGKSIRWLDLRPFEDILTEYGRAHPSDDAVFWFLDDLDLFRAPRDERLRVYAAAIVEGSARLKRGAPLLRQTAMRLAAADGLAELKPLIETHYAEETAQDRRLFPLPDLLVRLGLGAGAADREDAYRLASERLAAMNDGVFRDRMNTDEAFKKVVDGIASDVCAVDPFAPRRNPGCASIKDIVKRQLQLEKTTEEATKAATTTSISPMQRYEERRDSWLGRMQESSAGEPSVQRPH